MNKQRGIIAGYVYLVGAIAILGLLSGMAYMAKSYLDGVKTDAHAAGHKAALLEVAQRDNTQFAAVQKRVLQLQAELAAAEQRRRDEVARIDQEGTDALRKVEKERDAARRSAAQYAGRLRDPGVRPPDCGGAGGGGDAAAATVAGAGVDPGPGGARGGELSQRAGEFLRGEADRADEVVFKLNHAIVQLEACQQVARDDRRN